VQGALQSTSPSCRICSSGRSTEGLNDRRRASNRCYQRLWLRARSLPSKIKNSAGKKETRYRCSGKKNYVQLVRDRRAMRHAIDATLNTGPKLSA
jgi:hypothetical protein